MLEVWKHTPPPNVSLALLATAHGAKFEPREHDQPPEGEGDSSGYASASDGLSIAEIAASLAAPADLGGDDVTAASRRALELLHNGLPAAP